MFMGQYEHTIDPKGRLMIPVKFREYLNDGAVVTKGFEQNLMVLSTSAFDSTTKRIEELSVTQHAARLLQRQIFGFAQQVTLDKLGRILIPSFLRDTANLKDAVIVVGMSSFFEVWSPEQWKLQMNELQNPEADEQRYAAFNLPIG
ncbi:MAG: division/cell wall cluster transcriptional repressor MraZ [Chloroflexi bacterium]|nr:division/cell wall cluster transcriptional repressor MraZ [Chloroflexota bacterium]